MKNEKLIFALTVLKNFSDIKIGFNGDDYVATGETKKHKDILKACYFVWHNRQEQWIFNPWQSSNNPTNEWNRKKLKEQYGVQYA